MAPGLDLAAEAGWPPTGPGATDAASDRPTSSAGNLDGRDAVADVATGSDLSGPNPPEEPDAAADLAVGEEPDSSPDVEDAPGSVPVEDGNGPDIPWEDMPISGGPEPGPEPAPEPGVEPGQEPGPESGPERQPEPGAEPGPEPGPEPGREPGPEPAPEPGLDVTPAIPCTISIGNGQPPQASSTNPFCIATCDNIAIWNCNNIGTRTVTVNGVQKACGAAITKQNGFYVFRIGAGTPAYSGLWWNVNNNEWATVCPPPPEGIYY